MHSLNILSKAQINQVQDANQKVTLHRPNSITIANIMENKVSRHVKTQASVSTNVPA